MRLHVVDLRKEVFPGNGLDEHFGRQDRGDRHHDRVQAPPVLSFDESSHGDHRPAEVLAGIRDRELVLRDEITLDEREDPEAAPQHEERNPGEHQVLDPDPRVEPGAQRQQACHAEQADLDEVAHPVVQRIRQEHGGQHAEREDEQQDQRGSGIGEYQNCGCAGGAKGGESRDIQAGREQGDNEPGYQKRLVDGWR